MENYDVHINEFNSREEIIEALDNGTLKKPYVAMIKGVSGNVIDYNTEEGTDLSKEYLTVKLHTDLEGSFPVIINHQLYSAFTVEYKVSNGEWTSISGQATPIIITKNDEIRFKCTDWGYYNGTEIFNRNSPYSFIITGSSPVDVMGNIASMTLGDNFTTTALKNDQVFSGFFKGSNIYSAKNLYLPPEIATHQDGYALLFWNSTIVEAPDLTAQIVGNYAYYGMFQGCTGLTTAPTISAVMFYPNACDSMFLSCSNLTTAPALPALTLGVGCYKNMFAMCTSLINAPALPATTVGIGSYEQMFVGCSSLLVAPELPATTLYGSCYKGMFGNCTGLTAAPVLPATSITSNEYKQMFLGCTNLSYVRCLLEEGMEECTDWLSGVAATGVFEKPATSTWSTGASGIPEGWTVIDAE